MPVLVDKPCTRPEGRRGGAKTYTAVLSWVEKEEEKPLTAGFTKMARGAGWPIERVYKYALYVGVPRRMGSPWKSAACDMACRARLSSGLVSLRGFGHRGGARPSCAQRREGRQLGNQ